MKAYILHIDTALATATVGLSTNGTSVAFKINKEQKNHASFVHLAIEELLRDENILPTALKAIAVTEGPGSYTGIRVGMATAKGFCLALNKPLITINNLFLLAHAMAVVQPNENALYCPMIDARRMEVFTAVYNFRMNTELAPKAMIVDDKSFSDLLNRQQIVFAGDGSPKFKEIQKNHNALFIDEPDTRNSFVQLAHEKLIADNFSNLVDAIPFYAKEFYNV